MRPSGKHSANGERDPAIPGSASAYGRGCAETLQVAVIPAVEAGLQPAFKQSTRLILQPSVARGRSAQWLRRFAAECSAGVLARLVRVRLVTKRRRHGLRIASGADSNGAAAVRVVNKSGLNGHPQASASPSA